MAFAKFFKSLFLIFLLGILVWSPLLYFNVIIDPYDVFAKPHIHHHETANKRHTKIKYLLNHKDVYDSFIFGSSRVNYFDPANFTNGNYYNMTYSNGVAYEHLEDIKYLLRKGVKIKNLIIALDHMSLFEPYNYPKENLGRKKYPETFSEKISFYRLYLFNRPDIMFIKTVTGKGHLYWQTDMAKGTAISEAEDQLNADVEKHVQKEIFLKPFAQYISFRNFSDNMKSISEIQEIAERNAINITFFINPVHYVSFLNSNMDMYFESLEALAEITGFYDFGGLNEVTLNNFFYFEASHYTSHTSNLITDRLFNRCDTLPVGAFGAYVNKENISDHIREHRKKIDDFFEAVNLKNSYTPPVNLSDLKPGNFFEGLSIKAINNMPAGKDTIFSAAPVIFVRGIFNEETDISKVYVMVGDKFFGIEKFNTQAKYCDEAHAPFGEWISYIPGHQIGGGVHNVKAVVLKGEFYDTTTLHTIKALAPRGSFVDFNSLNQLPMPASIHITSADSWIDSSVTHYFLIKGRATDEMKQFPSGGIIAELGDYAFESQFVSDLYLTNQAALFDWGIVMPSSMLNAGKNEIVITALHPDRKHIFNNKASVTVELYYPDTINHLHGLTRLSQTTDYAIDYVNQYLVSQAPQPIPVDGRMLTIKGWAVDKNQKVAASNVIALIDGKQFTSKYGLARGDVARVLRNDAYVNSGWELRIPVRDISKGVHEIKFMVISNDGKSFYELPKTIRILIS